MAREGQAYTFGTDFNEVPGLYWITQGAQNGYPVIYVGQTDNLKRRLAQHYGDKRHCMYRYAPQFVFAIVINGQADRDTREAAEVAFYKPPCNEQLKIG